MARQNVGLGLASVAFYLAAQAYVRSRWPFGFVQLDVDENEVALVVSVRPDLGLSVVRDRFRVGMSRVGDLASLELAIATVAERKGHGQPVGWFRRFA